MGSGGSVEEVKKWDQQSGYGCSDNQAGTNYCSGCLGPLQRDWSGDCMECKEIASTARREKERRNNENSGGIVFDTSGWCKVCGDSMAWGWYSREGRLANPTLISAHYFCYKCIEVELRANGTWDFIDEKDKEERLRKY